jgi:dTDP-4-dehydrorhamnose reductase
MRVLVTGANGLVGRRLVRALLEDAHTVHALGRGPQRFSEQSQRLTYLSVDLADAPALWQAVVDAAPDAIVNPAGMTDVDGCERDVEGAYQANVEAVATLCRAARAAQAHLVHVSTDYVFDGLAGPYDIDAVPNPRGAYALTKHLGEQTVRVLAAPGAWAIARTAVVYGWPSAGKPNFGSWLVETLRAGKPIKLFEDQWVSPSSARNVARMLAELATRRCAGLWHTCGAEVIDRVTFGHRLCQRFGFDPKGISPSRLADAKLLSPRPAKSGLIVTKTSAELTQQPLSLEASLDEFWAEYKEAT